ncbi:TPM domain-containing protein [Spirochaeta thermophila]|nr:TPM domain-containing protein [Spirochaeta thermophila]
MAGKERPLDPRRFLTKEEQREILRAIEEVERRSTCEIRVHITRRVKGDVMEEAVKTFRKLGMYRTIHRTGVLFFLATENRAFAVVGDEGIHAKAGEGFWKEAAGKIEEYFRRGEFGNGLIAGIREVGRILETHFPITPDDVNELPDDISFE